MTKIFGESFLIIANHISEQIDFLTNWQKENTIKKQNMMIIDKPKILVSHIRQLKSKLQLKPDNNEKLLIVFLNTENITSVAQNAFLKILEEPPSFATIMLCAKNAYNLLPTTLSRCKKVYLARNHSYVIDNSYINIYHNIENTKHIYQRFEIAKTLEKDENISIEKFLQNYIYYIKSLDTTNYLQVATIDKYRKLYKKGIQKKLFLENLILELL